MGYRVYYDGLDMPMPEYRTWDTKYILQALIYQMKVNNLNTAC